MAPRPCFLGFGGFFAAPGPPCRISPYRASFGVTCSLAFSPLLYLKIVLNYLNSNSPSFLSPLSTQPLPRNYFHLEPRVFRKSLSNFTSPPRNLYTGSLNWLFFFRHRNTPVALSCYQAFKKFLRVVFQPSFVDFTATPFAACQHRLDFWRAPSDSTLHFHLPLYKS
ncbi:hypothetical protein METBIDRAFT_207789 [Metschnikowia bicuspidata var. bicuspidata NRRL YB-4993]|uniref:Uncharacterized protein n=1 Tax=Metschnikowia bicuspidata var. bicuspidata NRRL YB-4993 TaxID=869754 RepID=A0A1A0H6X3_9ASCO|nr:hypothetical protein METBIDRAFT_207789 [Metschnikowia bicuspidata var. bicuspidata NRRL YB-4993]OBA19781.1 hypothetical protein METBIDRAFT_207789 [Metschnikowia bicuspidata var. bicuspidata NRRL YB-4993]